MGDMYSSYSGGGGGGNSISATSPSGVTRSGSSYGISDPQKPGYGPYGLWGSPSMITGGGGSGGGSGGGGGSYTPMLNTGGGGGGGGRALQDPSGSFFDEFRRSWNVSPDQALANEKQGTANAHWNQVWGALSPMIGKFGQNPYTIGGDSGQGPEISVGPTFSGQQINQQVNAARAQGDAATGARIREAGRSMASRGFGSNSPLLAAMTNSYQNQNMATGADTERNIRQSAAEANSKQILDTQQARENQYASRQDENIKRAAPYFGLQNSLLQALTGLA